MIFQLFLMCQNVMKTDEPMINPFLKDKHNCTPECHLNHAGLIECILEETPYRYSLRPKLKL